MLRVFRPRTLERHLSITAGPADPIFAVIRPQKVTKQHQKSHHITKQSDGLFFLLWFLVTSEFPSVFPVLTFLSYMSFPSHTRIHKSVTSQGFVKTCCFSWNVLTCCYRADPASLVVESISNLINQIKPGELSFPSLSLPPPSPPLPSLLSGCSAEMILRADLGFWKADYGCCSYENNINHVSHLLNSIAGSFGNPSSIISSESSGGGEDPLSKTLVYFFSICCSPWAYVNYSKTGAK